MITHMTLAIRCGCGLTHDLPVDIEGEIGMICRLSRRHGTFRLDRAQFATLTRHHPDRGERIDRCYMVHRAGQMTEARGVVPYEGRAQRCEDCGLALVAYRAPVAVHDAWYAAGTLVTLADFSASYRARLPLNPLRERRCYERAM